jgi:AraC family transcriptional regulator
MEPSLRLLQPDLVEPGRSRRLSWPGDDEAAVTILNGRGVRYEGGTDAADLSLKWVPEGVAEYRAERSRFAIAPATQLMLNRGQPYRLKMLQPSETFVVFFSQALGDAAWQAHTGMSQTLPEIPLVGSATVAGTSLKALRDETRRPIPDHERLRELSVALLTEMVGAAARLRKQEQCVPAMRRTTRAELLRRLIRAEDYLRASGRRATLRGAAQAAALSPFHLIRVFEAVYGQTPLAYAAAQRLDAARHDLERSRFSVQVIAERAGYESRTAFDRAFAKRFGKTPAAARRS